MPFIAVNLKSIFLQENLIHYLHILYDHFTTSFLVENQPTYHALDINVCNCANFVIPLSLRRGTKDTQFSFTCSLYKHIHFVSIYIRLSEMRKDSSSRGSCSRERSSYVENPSVISDCNKLPYNAECQIQSSNSRL